MGSAVLFQVDAILSAPKIVLQPQSKEIYWLLMQCVRDCVESTKVRTSWLLNKSLLFIMTCVWTLFNAAAICTMDAWNLHWMPSTASGHRGGNGNIQLLHRHVPASSDQWKRHDCVSEHPTTFLLCGALPESLETLSAPVGEEQTDKQWKVRREKTLLCHVRR